MSKRVIKPTDVSAATAGRGPQSQKPLEDILDLKTRIMNGTIDERMAAVKEAARKKDQENVPTLMQAAIQIQKMVITLVENVEKDKLTDLQIEACEAIGKIGLRAEGLEKVTSLLAEGDESERFSAGMILYKCRAPELLPRFIEALRNQDKDAKEWSAMAIAEMASDGHDCTSAVEPLFASLVKEGRSSTRNEIKAALNAMGISEDEISKRVTDFTDLSDEIELMEWNLNALFEETAKAVERIAGFRPDGIQLCMLERFSAQHPELDRDSAIKAYFSKS